MDNNFGLDNQTITYSGDMKFNLRSNPVNENWTKTIVKAFLVEIKNDNKVVVHQHADPKLGDVLRFPGGIPVVVTNDYISSDADVLVSSINPDLVTPLKPENLSKSKIHYNSFVWKETKEIWAFVVYRGPKVEAKTEKHKRKYFCDYDDLLLIFPGGVDSVEKFGKIDKKDRFLTVFESEEETSKSVSMRPELGMAHLAEAINKGNTFYPVHKD